MSQRLGLVRVDAHHDDKFNGELADIDNLSDFDDNEIWTEYPVTQEFDVDAVKLNNNKLKHHLTYVLPSLLYVPNSFYEFSQGHCVLPLDELIHDFLCTNPPFTVFMPSFYQIIFPISIVESERAMFRSYFDRQDHNDFHFNISITSIRVRYLVNCVKLEFKVDDFVDPFEDLGVVDDLQDNYSILICSHPPPKELIGTSKLWRMKMDLMTKVRV
jgi:hypothetical protein